MDPAEKARLEHEAILTQCEPQACLRGEPPRFGGVEWNSAQIMNALAEYVTEERRDKIASVVAGRTRHLAVVVEGLVNTGNVSAVMRTAEALGFARFSRNRLSGGDLQSF